MSAWLFRSVFALALISRGNLTAGDLVLESGPARVSLLELYTSEGCSSCPPAEAWFSMLKENPRLWKGMVPIAFHVDYWNNLGWPDRYSSKEFTERQRNYAAAWGVNSVYTPAFVLNGSEWHRDESNPAEASLRSGVLKATMNAQRQLRVRYADAVNRGRGFVVHAALLGFDIETKVRGGENGGRTLRHDFIALGLAEKQMEANAAETVLQLPAPAEGERGLAVWITENGSTEPVQAAGGWLK